MKEKKPTLDDVIIDIASAIFMTLTVKEINAIKIILKDDDNDSISAANDICDTLDITKRLNRSAISKVLDKHYI